jgi:hypothetical protein
MSEYPSNYRSHNSSAMSFDLTTPSNHDVPSPNRSQENHAKWTYLKFIECLFDFEKGLDDDHEIGARLASYAPDVTFYLQDVSCYGPPLISFSGVAENGKRLQLVQHISQLSLLLVALEKRGEEPVRIGFKLKRAAEQES